MSTLVIGGAQWGDEGKGKITDYFAQGADIVVRFQGGNNAGHTINFNGKKYPLSLLPSGIFNPKCYNVLANGMVINPNALLSEMKKYEDEGFKFNLVISNRAQVLMPYHIDLDVASEGIKKEKIGTTKKGIGPCYSDKINRIGIRMGDLLNLDSLKKILENTLTIKNKELAMYGCKTYTVDELFDLCQSWSKELSKYICDTSIYINDAISAGKKVLFEGAQGAMLCCDNGTYPFVTSSSPLASSVPLNAGVAPNAINNVLGIVKAYSTRVGEGAFPTELKDDKANIIRERGHEYGTITKRPRRIGWLDAVCLRHAVRVGGITQVALMLLDVLTGFDELKICNGYLFNGKEINYVPANIEDFGAVKPIFITLPGWKTDITNISNYEDLPLEAKNYIQKIEELLGLPVNIISVGPDRNATIIRNKVW